MTRAQLFGQNVCVATVILSEAKDLTYLARSFASLRFAQDDARAAFARKSCTSRKTRIFPAKMAKNPQFEDCVARIICSQLAVIKELSSIAQAGTKLDEKLIKG